MLRRVRRSLAWAAAFVAAMAAFLHLPLELQRFAVAPGVAPSTTRGRSVARAAEATFAPAAAPDEGHVRAPRKHARGVVAEVEAPPVTVYRHFGERGFALHSAPTCSGGACAAAERFNAAIEERLVTLEAFEDSRAAADVLLLLGSGHHALTDYARAADYYEAFARAQPDARCPGDSEAPCLSAPNAMENAIVFRKALGQLERARDDADWYAETFERSRPQDAARVRLLASRLEPDTEARTTRLSAHLRDRRGRAAPSEAIALRVDLGETLLERGQRAEALTQFRRADRLWTRRGAGQMAAPVGSTPEEWTAELARTREDVGLARFRLAEARFERFSRMRAPAYRQAPRRRDITRWVRGRLRPWVARKLRALRAADRAYERVDGVGVTAWSIAAAARRGELYRQLAEQLRTLEVPRIVEDDAEGIAATVQYRENTFRVLVRPALERFRQCVELAERTRLYGDWSERCAAQLARLEPERYQAPPELRRRRSWVSETLPAE